MERTFLSFRAEGVQNNKCGHGVEKVSIFGKSFKSLLVILDFRGFFRNTQNRPEVLLVILDTL